MIGYLQGEILSLDAESALVKVSGVGSSAVGYEVYCSENSLRTLAGEKQTQFYIYTHVREDQITLFGFLSIREKQLFLSLLKVNGIGPKVALKILGAAPTPALLQMIEDADVKALSQLPKVGKKTAEQIVLELKGKLKIDMVTEGSPRFTARAEIVSALVHLGFKLNEVEKVVHEMPANIDVQEGVREGLQRLSSSF